MQNYGGYNGGYFFNPIRRNLSMVKGDTMSFGFQIQGLKGEEPSSIQLTCKETLEDTTPLFTVSLNDTIDKRTYDAEHDIYTYGVRIPPRLTIGLNAGRYFYDLELQDNGDTITLMIGRFDIEEDVTKSVAPPSEDDGDADSYPLIGIPEGLKKSYTVQKISDIASEINDINGSDGSYTTAEMSTALSAINDEITDISDAVKTLLSESLTPRIPLASLPSEITSELMKKAEDASEIYYPNNDAQSVLKLYNERDINYTAQGISRLRKNQPVIHDRLNDFQSTLGDIYTNIIDIYGAVINVSSDVEVDDLTLAGLATYINSNLSRAPRTPTFTEEVICENISASTTLRFTEDWTGYDFLKFKLVNSSTSAVTYIVTTPEIVSEIFSHSSNQILFNEFANTQYATYAKSSDPLVWNRAVNRNIDVVEVKGLTVSNVTVSKDWIYQRGSITPDASTVVTSFYDFDTYDEIYVAACDNDPDDTMPCILPVKGGTLAAYNYYNNYRAIRLTGNTAADTYGKEETKYLFAMLGVKYT